MRVSCSYCLCTYGHKPGEGVTSGICPSCLVIVTDDIEAGGTVDPEHIRAVADLRLPACQRVGGL